MHKILIEVSDEKAALIESRAVENNQSLNDFVNSLFEKEFANSDKKESKILFCEEPKFSDETEKKRGKK